MRLAIDVCVPLLAELELWRAGYKVPVRAQVGEPDEAWLARAVRAGCNAVVSADVGACREADRLGMYYTHVGVCEQENIKRTSLEVSQEILDAVEDLEKWLDEQAQSAVGS